MINKPTLLETDVWARTADPTDIEKPIQDKINTGFLYGEKPPHEGHNYYWQVFSEFLMHLNQNGVAEWDSGTTYNQGSITKHGTMIYFALLESTNIEPGTDSNTWAIAFSDKAPDSDKLDGMEPNELPVSDATQIELDLKVNNSETGVSTVGTVVSCTQAEYDAIIPLASTLYHIVG